MTLSYIELSKQNLVHNAKILRSLVGKKTKFVAVVKANAYGHGEREVVRVLERQADYFQIDDADELARVRKLTKKPILLLGYVAKSELSKVIKLGCELALYSLAQAEDIERAARKAGVKQKVHIAVDAHLGREGIMPKEVCAALTAIKSMKHINVVGMYAHFANIEDTTNFTHATKQIKEFEKAVKDARACGYPKLMTHLSATSGILAYEAKHKSAHSLVRVGVGLYGMWPSEHLKFAYRNKNLELLPVMTWKSHLALVKWLPEGHTVGYGLTYMTYKKTKIAVVPQGYSDGYDRGLSGKGEVLVRGKRCKVLGRVAMNMFVIDVTAIPDAALEDEVVLLGKQGNEEITAEEIGEWAGTINYEVTTRVSPLLPRISK